MHPILLLSTPFSLLSNITTIVTITSVSLLHSLISSILIPTARYHITASTVSVLTFHLSTQQLSRPTRTLCSNASLTYSTRCEEKVSFPIPRNATSQIFLCCPPSFQLLQLHTILDHSTIKSLLVDLTQACPFHIHSTPSPKATTFLIQCPSKLVMNFICKKLASRSHEAD